jgi:cellobiose phosphorylase
MHAPQRLSGEFPFRLQCPSGLSIQINANGSIRRMDYQGILLNLFLGTEMEGGLANLFLRRRTTPMEATPLLGPRSPASFRFEEGRLNAGGQWGPVRFDLALVPAAAAPVWFWHVRLKNTGSAAETLDLVHVQDLALAEYGAVRTNEFYTSQYMDHTPLSHPQKGLVLASRQNLATAGRHPWALIGTLGRGAAYCTDALQFYGLASRAGHDPFGLKKGLPNARRQHEHSMAGIQDAPVRLEPGGTIERGFFGWFEPNHPAASGDADLAFVDKAMALPEAVPAWEESIAAGEKPTGSLFGAAPLLAALDLTGGDIAALFGDDHSEEESVDGRLLSFFSDPERHVVLKSKELEVLRPHAHILRTGDRLVPDEASLTSTTWMGGVFHSMVTQGHVSINRFISTVHGYLGLFRADGLRVFLETDGGWRLLDVPSAYEMAPRGCRWIYKHSQGWIEVRSEVLTDRHELTLSIHIRSGPPARLLFVGHMAMNGNDGSDALPIRYIRDPEGILIHPLPDTDMDRRFPGGGFRFAPLQDTRIERIGGDELLFADGVSRKQPYLCIITAAGVRAGFSLRGSLVPETAGDDDPQLNGPLSLPLRIHPPAGKPQSESASRCAHILPWFIHNALIHYLAPRGIEQYTGGGWGTRDICQGPVEMLLALGRFEVVRDLLVRVFRAQNPDGDWPQWFMFFERERGIRAADSHGDIVFWPLLALSQYLNDSEDKTLLEETVPFFHPDGEAAAQQGSIRQHIDRALAVIKQRIVPGTRLAAYGHGDWNDSLQPVTPAMRDRLCSSWTATLHYQTLASLAAALDRLGQAHIAAGFASEAAGIREDFQTLLIKDGILTGFASFREDGRVDYLLHPQDRTTGLSYRLLPMIHAIINDLLTPEQAGRHLTIIAEQLLGPDGARLFDRPMQYRGGPMQFFQRAESAAFFGREIGLMYTHAHLRYAEALARYGDAPGFLTALAQANPVGIRDLVPAAALRQANCYYSSSDAAFADRYQAQAQYSRIRKGEIPLEGGWRVYSSGAGIWTRLFLQCFLGLHRQKSFLLIDPVIPASLDGLQVEAEVADAALEMTYHIRKAGCGPAAVALNGLELPFERSINPYRTGGAQIPMKAVRAGLRRGVNHLAVHLG